MNTLNQMLALVCVAALPACTVNYYGHGTGRAAWHRAPHQRPATGATDGRDTVYVNTGSTTVITQPGVVGAPAGGGYATGPTRTPPPPVRGGYGYGQPGGVRTPPNNYPAATGQWGLSNGATQPFGQHRADPDPTAARAGRGHAGRKCAAADTDDGHR